VSDSLHADTRLVEGVPDDPRWPALVARFNLRPAQYADASWLPDWVAAPDALPERLERELSAWLLAEHGLDGNNAWALGSEAARLFMLDAPARLMLAQALGVARHRSALRQVVLQPQVEALRLALGDTLDALWSPLAEAVEASPHRFVLPWSAFDGRVLREQLQLDGLRVLLSLFDPADASHRGAAQRAAFCLPRRLVGTAWPSLSAARARPLLQTIVTHAIPAWAPAWTWLF